VRGGRRRRRSHPRLFGGAFLIALCTTTAVAALAIGQVSTIAADISTHPIHSTYLAPPKPGGPETILVIGDDHSGPYDAQCGCHLLHADTFMLVRMDPAQGQTSIMSIPRDLLVNFTWKGAAYTDQKFNSAYAVGATPGNGNDQLVLKVAHQILPGVTINHFVDINFDAFIGVVHAIGCVYVDVDHRYLNNDDPAYQPINLQPGYQRLCAEPALSYVRYRHDDSDFVRVARQQDFIRQAKEQLGLFDLVGKLDQIAKAFGQAIHTDIYGIKVVNQLLTLVAFSQSRPIRQVPFQYANADTWIGNEEYVTSTPALIRASVRDFLHENQLAQAPPSQRSPPPRHGTHHHRTRRAPSAVSGLVALSAGVVDQAQQLAVSVPFPVELPSMQTLVATPNDFHPYKVIDEQGQQRSGYRIDWYDNQAGLYYGIEGMDWTDPPLFANPTATATIDGRTYMFIDDGSHFHDIGWRVGGELYWVSNTLLEHLSNAQMLALAESAKPIG
jgi:LCP family protein required for cell wall assembly